MNNQEKIENKIIVRFPPSPTGKMHIGNIRTLLFNYLFARQNGGDIVMRFEDTDRERSKKEYEDFALKTLEILGLDFDRGPFRQSDRGEFYEEAISTLLEKSRAFEAEESKDGSGEKVIRFKNPNKKIKFIDSVRGEIEIDTTDFGDFVIARSRTNPIYHLTVVVDDIDMGITHVIRGEDHITSTPRQILLLEALGGSVPAYTHLPLIVGEDNKKLGKRHGAVNWDEFEKLGYLPDAILNYLALLGWNPGKGNEREIFSKEDLLKEFSLERVNNSPAKFSYVKLDSVNKHYLNLLSDEEFYSKGVEFLSEESRVLFESDAEKGRKIFGLVVRERVSKLSEISEMDEAGEFEYLFERPEVGKERLAFKDGSVEDSLKILETEKEKLEAVSEDDWNKDFLKELLWDWSGEVGRGQALHPLRTALSGKDRSPDPFTLMDILGKEESLERLSF